MSITSPKIKLPLPAFTIICFFVVLMVIGLAVAPLLTVKLEPSRNYNSISVYCDWNNSTAEMMENEVVSKVESMLAMVKGIKMVSSTSGNGRGTIYAELDEGANADQVRYEVSILMRQLYPKLPSGVRYPGIYVNRPFGNKTILQYTINGNLGARAIQDYAERKIRPELSRIKDIEEIKIYGAEPMIWKLRYDQSLISKYGLSVNHIRSAIDQYFYKAELGKATVNALAAADEDNYSYLTLVAGDPQSPEWEKIVLSYNNDRMIYLHDVAQVSQEEKAAGSYYRINGQSTVTLEVVAYSSANNLLLAKKVKEQITLIKTQLPEGYTINQAFDVTDFLKKEMNKVIWRTLATLFILMAFILAISRQIRYLILIAISLVSNILLAFICYYFLKLEIHLYSLAGITVSMGIIIDNSIVVIDHIRHKHNLRVLLAVTGATLTTIGAVCIVFFLNANQQIKLLDFAWVMIINLSISLIIALFFIPALMEKMPLKTKKPQAFINRKRRIVKWTHFYQRAIDLGMRHKKKLLMAAVLLFGLPVFMLPNKIEREGKGAEWYNMILGSETYQGKIRPWTDRIMGGTLRLFITGDGRFAFSHADQQRTQLNVSINLPYGSRLEHMNPIVRDLEVFLSQIEEVAQYQAKVHERYASINIFLKPDFEKGSFPYQLKSRLEQMAVYTGLAEFDVWGVGEGFSNRLHEQGATSGIQLLGYNYEHLLHYAEEVKKSLQSHMRVEKVSIGKQQESQGQSTDHGFVFKVTDEEKLLVNQLSSGKISNSLNDFSGAEQQLGRIGGMELLAVSTNPKASVWQVMNEPVRSDSTAYVRLKEFAQMEKDKIPNEILRENQQYKLVVSYNFIGDYSLGNLVAEKIMTRVKAGLPLGYSIKKTGYNFYSDQAEKLTWAILLTIGIVFVICSILLNNILQPLSVIAMIPISFIGVFITVAYFNIPFNEGGYAAMIILCGVVVNAALYILNDFNNLRKDFPSKPVRLVFLKSYNSKIVPVLLSTVSMILSLLPFIFYVEGDTFWYVLAMCVTGGLSFSMLAILIFLPVLLIRNPKKINPSLLIKPAEI